MSDDPGKVLRKSMITYGNHLKTAKEKGIEEHIHAEVTNLTRQLLKQLQNDQHPPFPENIILKILEKIEASLQQFKELDSNRSSAYKDLLNKTKECKSQKKQALETRLSSSAGVSLQDTSPANGESTQAEGSASDGPGQQQEEFTRLGNVEKKCLFCFCLFPLGREVKKREPIHLWVGTGLVADSFEGGVILNRLVGEGFIQCTMGKNKMFKRYLMKEQVRSMIVKEINIEFEFNKDTILSIMSQNPKQKQHQQEQPTTSQQEQSTASQQQQHQQEQLMSGSLVINKNENTTLQSRDFESISKLKNDVKVFHLSSCFDNTKSSYIVVEAEALKALTRHIGQVVFLSLQGISGIVELPDSIYKLVNLKVLDLRGCPNLEFLPDGIESLTKLTHLDLSECYLLDHIPMGVALLTELRVLKGFIINPDVVSKTGNNKNIKNQRNTSSAGASFSELKALEKLKKLAIRTRRGDFPTADDLVTMCAMKELANLKIAWVCNYKIDFSSVSESGRFPASLKKLELQATPENTLLRLLKLISDDKQNSLQKFYIRGGQFWHLGLENYCLPHVHTIRLRYLHELHVDWVQLKEFYPNLTRVEVFDCPNLFFFPCDQNGVWDLDIE